MRFCLCGAAPRIWRGDLSQKWGVTCDTCGRILSCLYPTEVKAVEAWDKRWLDPLQIPLGREQRQVTSVKGPKDSRPKVESEPRRWETEKLKATVRRQKRESGWPEVT